MNRVPTRAFPPPGPPPIGEYGHDSTPHHRTRSRNTFRRPNPSTSSNLNRRTHYVSFAQRLASHEYQEERRAIFARLRWHQRQHEESTRPIDPPSRHHQHAPARHRLFGYRDRVFDSSARPGTLAAAKAHSSRPTTFSKAYAAPAASSVAQLTEESVDNEKVYPGGYWYGHFDPPGFGAKGGFRYPPGLPLPSDQVHIIDQGTRNGCIALGSCYPAYGTPCGHDGRYKLQTLQPKVEAVGPASPWPSRSRIVVIDLTDDEAL